jgi:nucleoside-diphosphate kinase
LDKEKEERLAMPIEKTFVLIKPEGIQRGLLGEIIKRLERKGIKLIGLKMVRCSAQLAERLYAVHRGKDFYKRLINHLTSGPVITMVLEGEGVIEVARKLVGPTDPKDGKPGEIRFDYSQQMPSNLIHAADNKESAEFEISLFFSQKELIEYKKTDEDWLFRKS